MSLFILRGGWEGSRKQRRPGKVAEPGPSCRGGGQGGVGLLSTVASSDFVFVTGTVCHNMFCWVRVLWMLFPLEICASEYADQQMGASWAWRVCARRA